MKNSSQKPGKTKLLLWKSFTDLKRRYQTQIPTLPTFFLTLQFSQKMIYGVKILGT